MQYWAGVMVGALLVGCAGGSRSEPPAVGTAFHDRATDICTAAQTEKKTLAFPYPDFNPTDPDVSKLPGIARYEVALIAFYDNWIGQLRKLGDPPSGRPAWSRFLAAVEQHLEVLKTQQRAAEQRAATTFTGTYRDATALEEPIRQAGDAAGVPACAAVDL